MALGSRLFLLVFGSGCNCFEFCLCFGGLGGFSCCCLCAGPVIGVRRGWSCGGRGPALGGAFWVRRRGFFGVLGLPLVIKTV